MATAVGGLVGREDELAVVGGLLADLHAGRGGALWIDGEPGIGKSALVDAAVSAAPASGVRLFRAAADELTQSFALRLAADCLGVDGTDTDEYRAEIVALLAGHGAAVDAVSAASERLLALVDRECARSPVLLIGDDLQWADAASLGVWYRLIAAAGQQPLLLISVCRPVPLRAEVERLRHAIDHHPHAVGLHLEPLTHDAVTVMAQQALAAPPGPNLTSLLHQAAGNPLYLREVLDTLIRDGAVHTTHGVAELAAPAGQLSLGAAIGRRLGFLPTTVRTTLRAASILDNRFTVDDWALITDQTVPQLTTTLEEALTAGVLTGADTALTFRHPLIRQTLHDELPAPLRIGLHAYAAKTLANAGQSWDRVARHLLAAPDAIDGWALDWLAAIPAEALFAQPTTSEQLLHTAREHLVPSDPRWALLTTRLTTVLRLVRRREELISVGVQAMRTVTSPQMIGEIAWNLSRGYSMAGRFTEQATLTRGVLDGPGLGIPWRSRIRAELAHALYWTGDETQSRVQAQQAVSEGEQDGDPFSVGWGLSALAWGGGPILEEGLDLIDRALQVVVGEDTASADLRLHLLTNRVIGLMNLSRTAAWRAELPGVIALAERAGSPRQVHIKRTAAMCHYEHGDWDQALVYLDQLQGAPPTSPQPDVASDGSDAALVDDYDWTHIAQVAGTAALIALHRGDRATAERHLSALSHTTSDPTMSRLGAQTWLASPPALLAEIDGQPERATAMLAGSLNPQYPEWNSPDFLADVIRLAIAVGDWNTAQTAMQIAEAGAEINTEPTLVISAGVCRAMVEDDPATLLTAAEHLDRVGRRPFQAFVLQEAAVRHAQQGDLPAARDAFTQALAIYDDLGSVLDLRRIQARLRPYGIRRGSRAGHRRVLVGWDALTQAERTVATLVSHGDSNPQIAAQLFLSRRTVETHVTHILHKLQVRSRIDIAHVGSQHQPAGNSAGPGRPAPP